LNPNFLCAPANPSTRHRASEMGIGFMEKPITEARIRALIGALE
jgi:hypothetical protein